MGKMLKIMLAQDTDTQTGCVASTTHNRQIKTFVPCFI